MNLYTLQKEINTKRAFQKLIMSKIKQLRESLEPKSPNLKEIVVQGSAPKRDINDVIHDIVELEKQLKLLNEEIEIYTPILKELEQILKEYNERDQLVYYYVKIKGYTATKAGFSVYPQIGERQVQKIVKKIEKKLSEEYDRLYRVYS